MIVGKASTAAFLMFLIGMPAFAQTSELKEFQLTPAELAEARGGFYTVDGVTFDFGATINTTVDGVPVLQSILLLTPEGAKIISGDPGLPSPNADGFFGVTLPTATGDTTVLHRLTDGRIQGIILNDASGRTIEQNINIALTLPGFQAVQADIDFARNAARLNADMALGLVNSARN